MPTTRTAKKRLRQNEKRRTLNRADLARMRTELKKAEGQIDGGKIEEAAKQVGVATKHIDKAAKKNLIHRNQASRMKSKLAKKLGQAEKK
ncbi:MAG: 30S ribosomal protein S20 [Planctomycetota bacterium]|jgi:small subunit ribosomal protein S20